MSAEKHRRVLNLQQRSTLAGEAAAAATEVEAALRTPDDPISAAFFDVDNTVMQGASIFHLARGLHRRDFFTTREILGAIYKQVYFRVVGVEDPEHVADARSSALAFIAGHTVAELEELGEEIFDEAMAHRIWPGTRALAQLHLDQGQRVWLVTAAPIEIASAAWKQAYFRIVGVEDPEHVASTRASALSFIAGHTVTELEELSEEIFDEAMAHRIWPGTRALAQMHLDEGQRVWLVTAAPIEIAQIIARRLGLTGALGTVAEHVDGVYTGRLVGDMLHGPAKGEALKALAEREGLDLAACSAYSDSYNDLTMLSLVGVPTAINPDARLRAYAKRQGWPIRDYRTGRKAARAGLLAAGFAGAVTGAVAAGAAVRRRR